MGVSPRPSKGDRGLTARPTGSLRIGVVAHFYPPHVGGLEVVAKQVATGLATRGHRVDVLTSAGGGQPGTTVEHGVHVTRLRAFDGLERHGVPFPVFGPTLLWRAWTLARRSDVVHVHDMLYLSSWVVALACRLLRTPYVVTQHVGMVEHPSRVVRLVQALVLRTVGSLVLRGAASVLPISPTIEAWTREKLPGARTRVLRNGIDRALFRRAEAGDRAATRRRFGLPEGEHLVLFVGRFVPKKGFDVVAAAAGEGYRVVFVGGDRPAHVAESPDRIFLGALSSEDVAAIYRACDVFVCASVGEGPMTPMEALLSGCAVVVNKDPAMRALGLGDGVLEIAMTAESLRECLVTLVGRPGAVRELASRGRRVADEVPTWVQHLDELETVLVAAVGGAADVTSNG
ncbi:glycosyltransferase family 4 protein [Nocardioides deserti]|uniref:Glycosyltransferase family 4 protein n=1 Tax=Nocardioides deserti TaxID=1588644 RepID=A0ABR6U7D3_9ACTN|nr:glycosyltransferase family 4 protein [Nocardioides deserti]MBC2960283.1 glycosyltransferase family 4 protein [Nocardioides deserti]GGO71857.1 glycosyl transferase [Nocardioides deserti]